MLPAEYIDRIREFVPDAEGFLASYEKPYVKALRINSLKNFRGILSGNTILTDKVKAQNAVPWERQGLYYYEENDACSDTEGIILRSPGKSPLHAAGAYYIQEASAMLPVSMLDISEQPLKVLDLCAAPGGKTTQIASYMKGRGLLVCNEIVNQRARILSENIERMGVSNALVISEDPNRLVTFFPRFFDRILVDAPCSGEGMFRKHPEAMDEWSVDNVKICADRQDNILDCAAQMLAPGGRIVYSTCTFNKEEDEGSVLRFLNRHPEFQTDGDVHRIFPHTHRGEGHFSAAFIYKAYFGAVAETSESTIAGEKVVNNKKKGKISNFESRINKEQKEALITFCNDTLKSCRVLGVGETGDFRKDIPKEIEDRLFMFGDRIFLAPEYMPSLNAITVLRPGLHLGTVIKGRFEPSHSFALVLSADEVRLTADYPEDSNEIAGYLRGQTLTCEGAKGWTLILTEGISLGWGKTVGTIIKNHYPKGLRIMG